MRSSVWPSQPRNAVREREGDQRQGNDADLTVKPFSVRD